MTETAAAPFAVTMDGPTWLSLEMHLAGITPEAALAWFTDREKVLKWWGQDVEIDPVAGGIYEVRWPAMGWTMRGEIAVLTDRLLAYSWSWDHEPDLPARAVIVRAEDRDGGSLVTFSHGPYRPGAAFLREDEDRQAHRDGWANFLPALKRVAEAPG